MWDHATGPIFKRAIESTTDSALPWWSGIVFLVDLILLLPIILVVSYTIKLVFPVLAFIEDQNPPPAYQPLPLNEDVNPDAVAEPDASVNKNTNDPHLADWPVTSSLRSTWKLVKSHGGYRDGLLRGFWCLFAYSLAQSAVFVVVAGVLPPVLAPAATLLASLGLVQLAAAWVHVVATPPSPLRFWRRLPPFRKTLAATALPTVLVFLANQAANNMPYAVARLCGVHLPDLYSVRAGSLPAGDGGQHYSWVAVPVALTAVVPWFLLVIPAQVALTRTQASLLPPDEHTVVPFDRSFGSRIEPDVVGGKGYATAREAFASLGAASWKRIYVLYVKLFLVDCAFMALAFAVVIPELLVMKRFAPDAEPTGN